MCASQFYNKNFFPINSRREIIIKLCAQFQLVHFKIAIIQAKSDGEGGGARGCAQKFAVKFQSSLKDNYMLLLKWKKKL